MRIYEDLTKTVGNTPLFTLNRITKGLDATVTAKDESFSPLSSAKDRIGVAMIEAAEMLAKNPRYYYITRQFRNPADPEIHRKTTAEEISQDADGKFDILMFLRAESPGRIRSGVLVQASYRMFSGLIS